MVVVSEYSIATAILFFNVGLAAVKILRNHTKLLAKNSTNVLMLLFLLSIVRILLPLDLEMSYIVRSDRILPFIQKVLRKKVVHDIDVGSLILGIWLAGTVYMLFSTLIKCVFEKEILNAYTAEKVERIQKIAEQYFGNKAEVMVSSDVNVPIVTGITKACILIPPLELSDQEIRLILMHEFQHVKEGDIFVKLFYLILKAVFWWNPIVHVFHREIDNLLELRCDAAVTKNMEEKEKIAYVETILKVMKYAEAEQRNYFNSATLVSSHIHSFTYQRFDVILNQVSKTKSKGQKIVTLSMIFGIFLASYSIVVQPAYEPPVENVTGYVEINEETAYLVRDKNGNIELYIDDKFYSIPTKEELKTEPLSLLEVRKE